jgi:hypothetical protein
MRVLPAAVLILLALSPFASWPEEAPPSVKVQIDPQVNPWTSLDIKNDPAQFQFAVVTDRTGGHRPGVFEDAVRKLNLLHPEFVMSVGDLIEGYSDKVHEIDTQWDEFMGFVHDLKMPFFFVPGNHDISSNLMTEKWKERFGRSYFHFVYRDVLFLCLNTEDPPPTHMSPEQKEYAAKALAENPNVRWTLVFMHKPMWTYPDSAGWQDIEALLAGRHYTVFTGHNHTYVKYTRNDNRYFILATTGGSSELRGPIFGEFDHLAWITMTEEGPVIANLMLDGIWDENIRTPEIASAMDAVVEGRVLRCDPIVTESPAFSESSVRLRLTNDADVPMHIHGALAGAEGIQATPPSFDKTVPPNSVDFVETRISASRPVAVATLGAFRVDWVVGYQFENHKPVEIPGSRFCPVDTVFTISRCDKAPAVDGNLDDWAGLPFVCSEPSELGRKAESWKGPQDGSFRFAATFDDKFIYIGIRAVDDELQIEPSASLKDQDGFEVLLDARPSSARRAGKADKKSGEILEIPLGVDQTADQLSDKEKLPSGLQAQSRKTATGYEAEMAIPITYLDQVQGAAWKDIRLNIAMDDRDSDGRAQIWWRPDWTGEDDFEGSGTFRKQP